MTCTHLFVWDKTIKKNIYHINPVVSSHSPLLGNTFSIKPLIDFSKRSDDYMFKE
ncbi:hypothetical protein BAC_0021 [Bacillus anthracis str. A0488]|nr:hypothetical protein BAC_0021 [Bacillus anthracis str. A0488]EDT65128.1 hypothetical protein BAO_0020 [Bacillus anthracis str. A0174]EEM91895.1 hypothetical protein bthur0012_160 [Bacillus thuringiensis serovar pulsiensis BGSC 4CC1]